MRMHESAKTEEALVREYMDLTGVSEAQARAVFMHLFSANGAPKNGSPVGEEKSARPREEDSKPSHASSR